MGTNKGTKNGEWTYIGNTGETVIDYGRVEEFRIGGKSRVEPSPARNK
jgi:hypothetical protein